MVVVVVVEPSELWVVVVVVDEPSGFTDVEVTVWLSVEPCPAADAASDGVLDVFVTVVCDAVPQGTQT